MKKSRTLSVFLAILLVFLLVSPQSIIAIQQAQRGNDLAKLHLYLGRKKNYVNSEKELSAELKDIRDEDSDEPIFLMAEFKCDYFETPEYWEYDKKLKESKNPEERQASLHEAHVFSKQFHEQVNEQNFELLKDFDCVDYSFIGYAPFIQLELNRKTIDSKALIELVKNDTVANISIYKELLSVNSGPTTWLDTLSVINAFSTVTSGLYTGEWAKVGIFEAAHKFDGDDCGICNVSHTNLSGKDITVDSNCNYVSDHATIVTSIAALIAPEASYYVSNNHSVAGLAWFIDNDCTVVNCSFAYTDTYKISDETYGFLNTGYRYFLDGLYDYQIRANHISCVVASSNVCNDNMSPAYNPDGYIISPGLAYNAITVGGVEKNHLTFQVGYEPSACYLTNVSRTKPEISAVNYLFVPNNSLNVSIGTSFAAPQVTGCIALFLEMFGNHYLPPNELKAAVIASASKTSGYNETLGFFDEKVGAGCIDFRNMREFDYLAEGFIVTNFNDNPNNIISSDNITLSKNQTIQVACAWYANVTTSPAQTSITNLDLRLYNSNGVLVASSALDSSSNTEFIRYIAPSAGTYTVSIYQNGNLQSSPILYGIAVCVD